MPEQDKMVAAFNEWMRRYTEEPEKFEHEFRTVAKFLEEDKPGQEPSYGQTSAAYLRQLMGEV